MHPYVTTLQKSIDAYADPEAARPMKAYMRNQFDYLGISGKRLGELHRAFIAEHGLPAISELPSILAELWQLPQREYQYLAMGQLSRRDEDLSPDFISTLEYLLVTKSWWDTVDTLAGGSVGKFFKRFPNVRDTTLTKWRISNDFWLRRTCILFQLGYKKDTDWELLKAIINENLGSKQFFINKAIGWALRKYSFFDGEAVRSFVAETPLHSLSAREALRWLTAQENKLNKGSQQ